MAKPTFRDDVIIAAVTTGKKKGKKGKKKGKPVKRLFKLSQEDLKSFEVPYEDDPDYEEVVKLLESGVQVAAIPISKENGGAHARGDLMCYLLNLSGLKTLTDWEDD